MKKGVGVALLLAGVLIGLFLSHFPGRWKGIQEAMSPSGELLLGDFESEKDLAKWESHGVSTFISEEHVVRGSHSVKLSYTKDGSPSFMMEDYLEDHKRARDWKGYEALTFTLFSTEASQERLGFQLKDGHSRVYKEDIFVPAHHSLTVTIPLEEVASFVDLKDVTQLNLFRWNPKANAIFFLDDVRLVPKRDKKQKTAAAKPEGVQLREDKSFDGTISTTSPDAESGVLFRALAATWKISSEGETFLRVPIQLVTPQSLSGTVAVSGGVPFPFGLLKTTTSFQLRTPEGKELPLQIKPLGFWEDGSVKWLLIETQLAPGFSDKGLFLEIHRTAPSPKPATPLRLAEDSHAITVVTGPLKFSISKERFTLFQNAFLDLNGDGQFSESEKVSDGGDLLIRFKGTDYRSSLSDDTSLTVEEAGPLQCTLKASGWLKNAKGEKFCQYQVRIQAFSGKSEVRVYHTFIYTGYPANRYHFEYQHAVLPENEMIEEVAVEHSFPVQKEFSYQVGLPTEVLLGKLKKPLRLAQASDRRFALLQEGEVLHQGEVASGWVDVSSPAFGTAVLVRDFWQQYPKEIFVDPAGKMKISLWPVAAGPLDLQTEAAALGPDAEARGSAFGLAKTHELIFSFHPREVEPKALHETFRVYQEPPVLHADAEWIYATYALGSLGPYQPGMEGESLLSLLFNWAARQPKEFRWYGMLNYGDTLFWYRKEAPDKSYSDWGWHPDGRWGWFSCEQVGNHAASLLQFARTGQYKYFAFGEAAARHMMDVDTIHYDTVANDPRLRGKIMGDHSHVGAMHRHNANHWGGEAEEASHTHVLGFLLYYYLTGYERAFDVAKEVGSFYLRNPITYARHPEIAPQRAMANVLWGDTLLYEATRDQHYKEGADRLAALFVKGQREDGGWGENYNPLADTWKEGPATRFMALHTLPALVIYHRLTGNSRVKEALLKGTEYLIQNEPYLPFFDAIAYSYELTGDKKFLDEGSRRLTAQIVAQDRAASFLRNGMLFEKITYDRVPPLLYSAPYFFGMRNPELLKSEPSPPRAAKGIDYEVRIVSPIQRVLMSSPVEALGHANPVQLSLAANEYESSQIVLYSSSGDLKGIRIEAEDLVNAKSGSKIDKKEISLSPVGYVELKKSDILRSLIGFVPDPLPKNGSFDVARGKAQPVWLTVYAPPHTAPGLYEGALRIRPENGSEKKVALKVTVWDFELPKTSRLKTAFDLYPSRIASAYRDFFPEWWGRWKDSFRELEDRYYERMLAYRISPVLNIDPKKPEDVDRVKHLLSLGMTSFAVGRYSGSNDNNWPKDLSSVIPLYREYGQLLRDYSFLDHSYIYTYDEPSANNEKVAFVAKAVHEADPALKNLVVLQETPNYASHERWFKDIDIVCLRNVAFDPVQAEAIRKAGKELWVYASGPSYPYPTFVLDYPTMAYRILPWMCWKYKATGLLFWCVNFWTTNPYTNPMNTKWEQNANGSLFYPGPNGPVGSIRLELLRDGIEDYDMIAILSDQIQKAKSEGAIPPKVIQDAEKVLSDAGNLATSMRDYPKEADRLYELREGMAASIIALKGKS